MCQTLMIGLAAIVFCGAILYSIKHHQSLFGMNNDPFYVKLAMSLDPSKITDICDKILKSDIGTTFDGYYNYHYYLGLTQRQRHSIISYKIIQIQGNNLKLEAKIWSPDSPDSAITRKYAASCSNNALHLSGNAPNGDRVEMDLEIQKELENGRKVMNGTFHNSDGFDYSGYHEYALFPINICPVFIERGVRIRGYQYSCVDNCPGYDGSTISDERIRLTHTITTVTDDTFDIQICMDKENCMMYHGQCLSREKLLISNIKKEYIKQINVDLKESLDTDDGYYDLKMEGLFCEKRFDPTDPDWKSCSESDYGSSCKEEKVDTSCTNANKLIHGVYYMQT